MTKLGLKDIQEARERIKGEIVFTPVKHSAYFSEVSGRRIWLKLENFNHTGSFKVRGAANLVLQCAEAKKNGVVAASAGNHAQGVARICGRLGISSTIFMPRFTPQVKIESTKRFGSSIELVGSNYDEAYESAEAFAKSNNATLVHAFKDPRIICGQGTVGLEIAEQIPDVKAVIIPIGGGGLISGSAIALKELKPHVKIIGVQTAYYSKMKEQFTQVDLDEPVGRTIADGIAVKKPGDLNTEIVKEYVDEIVTVNDDEISQALFHLMENDNMIAEGAGAASLASLIAAKSEIIRSLRSDDPICCVVSGGNIDTSLLSRITSKVLAMTGRQMRIRFFIDDRPGNLAAVLKQIAELNINILKVSHNRVFTGGDAYKVECHFHVETFGREHQQQLLDALRAKGYEAEKVI